ncbi:MAG: HDIG domain-containing protein [Sumerlaeia bacterium]
MEVTSLVKKARQFSKGSELFESRRQRSTRWYALTGIFIATVFITSPAVWRKHIEVEEGEVLTAPIVAEMDFDYVPPDAEEKWEAAREQSHARIYVFDPRVERQAIARVEKILAAARQLKPEAVQDPEELRIALEAADPQLGIWTTGEIVGLAGLSKDERFGERVRNLLENFYFQYVVADSAVKYRYLSDFRRAQVISAQEAEQVVETGGEALRSDGVLDRSAIELHRVLEFPNEVRPQLQRRIDQLILDLARGNPKASVLRPGQTEAAKRLINLVVKPNLRYDAEATELARENFERPATFAQPVPEGTYLAGNESTSPQTPHVISARESTLLHDYRRTLRQWTLMQLGAQAIFVLIAFIIVAFFVRKSSTDLKFNSRTIYLLSMPVLLALGLGRVFLLLGDVPYIGYAFPAGLIGILAVLLMDVRMALLLVTWGCLLFGLETRFEFDFVLVGLFGGYTAVAALYTFRERREVLYAGALIGVVNAATITIVHLINGKTGTIVPAAAVGAFSGMLSALIAYAVAPLFESAFRITTDLRLLELSGLQHPLLRRLEEEAPGTWQHTLNVTKLAEPAAQAIGANYLLVRAACLYHDIGKLSKPGYFTENQTTAEEKRRHAQLSPHISTLVILNHVKEGVEMARKASLPNAIIDHIQQHHGSSRVNYFYLKAINEFEEGKTKDPVREEDYRYPGPKPQSIEAAIIMLADTVEATATAKLSSRSVREDDIQLLVRNAITEKFNDGQFDSCRLTMQDLNVIRESLIRTLRSRFHTRIDYPPKSGGTAKAKGGAKAPGADGRDGQSKATPQKARKEIATAG